jgi:hypothetical protein
MDNQTTNRSSWRSSIKAIDPKEHKNFQINSQIKRSSKIKLENIGNLTQPNSIHNDIKRQISHENFTKKTYSKPISHIQGSEKQTNENPEKNEINKSGKFNKIKIK